MHLDQDVFEAMRLNDSSLETVAARNSNTTTPHQFDTAVITANQFVKGSLSNEDSVIV